MGDKQQDIRKWMSSPGNNNTRTPSRRRRVMSTSESEEERNMSSQRAHQLPDTPIVNDDTNGPVSDRHNTEAAGPATPEVIQLSTTSEDSMYVPLARQSESRGSALPAHENSRNSHHIGRHSQRSSTQLRQHHGSGRKRPKYSELNFCCEAEETSTSDTSTSQCDESEPNAQILYRQAITGVRNAMNSRSQLRRATINCPVCDKFAAYLQHFL
jgi:hypothetical protein